MCFYLLESVKCCLKLLEIEMCCYIKLSDMKWQDTVQI